jgi:hypothetical protein
MGWVSLLYTSELCFLLHLPFFAVFNPSSSSSRWHTLWPRTAMFVSRIILNAIAFPLLLWGGISQPIGDNDETVDVMGSGYEFTFGMCCLGTSTILYGLSYVATLHGESEYGEVSIVSNRVLYYIAHFGVINYVLDIPGRHRLIHRITLVINIITVIITWIHLWLNRLAIAWGCYVGTSPELVDMKGGLCWIDGVQGPGCRYGNNAVYCAARLKSPYQTRWFWLLWHMQLVLMLSYILMSKGNYLVALASMEQSRSSKKQ